MSSWPRIGIVGVGAMGEAHLRSYRAAGVEPAGVLARREASARAFEGRHGVPCFGSADELFAACDVVDLCLPTDLHADWTVRAASAGLHVACEKPIARSEADAEAMIEACARHGVRLYVAQVLRFFPTYAAAYERVRDGAIGELTTARLTRAAEVPADSWIRDEARSGGLRSDLLVHDVDFLLWLLGRPESVRHPSLPVPDGAPPEAVAGRIDLAWASGTEAQVEGRWNVPGAVTGLELVGTKGRLLAASGRLVLTGAAGAEHEVPIANDDPYVLQAEHLVDALRRGTPFLVDPKETLSALVACTQETLG